MEERVALPSAKLRKGMPERVPLLLIGRLAVDTPFQGIGLGTDLLADALRRCLATSEIAGVRAVIAHAIDDGAVRFYYRYGFLLSPLGDWVMLISIETIRTTIARSNDYDASLGRLLERRPKQCLRRNMPFLIKP